MAELASFKLRTHPSSWIRSESVDGESAADAAGTEGHDDEERGMEKEGKSKKSRTKLKEELAAAREELAAATEEIERLKREVETKAPKEESRKRLKEELAAAREEVAAATEEIERLKREVEAKAPKEETRKRLKEELAAAREEVARWKAEVETLKVQQGDEASGKQVAETAAAAEAAELMAELTSFKQQAADLAAELAEAQRQRGEEAERSREKLKEVELQLGQLQGQAVQAASLQQSLERAEKEASELKQQIKEVEAAAAERERQLASEIEQLKSEMEEKASRGEDREQKKVLQLEGEIQELQARQEEHAGRIAALCEEKEALVREVGERQRREEELLQRMAADKEQLSRVEEEADEKGAEAEEEGSAVEVEVEEKIVHMEGEVESEKQREEGMEGRTERGGEEGEGQEGSSGGLEQLVEDAEKEELKAKIADLMERERTRQAEQATAADLEEMMLEMAKREFELKKQVEELEEEREDLRSKLLLLDEHSERKVGGLSKRIEELSQELEVERMKMSGLETGKIVFVNVDDSNELPTPGKSTPAPSPAAAAAASDNSLVTHKEGSPLKLNFSEGDAEGSDVEGMDLNGTEGEKGGERTDKAAGGAAVAAADGVAKSHGSPTFSLEALKIEGLKKQLEAAIARYDAVHDDNEEIKREMEGMRQQVEQARQRLEDAEREKENMLVEIELLNDELRRERELATEAGMVAEQEWRKRQETEQALAVLERELVDMTQGSAAAIDTKASPRSISKIPGFPSADMAAADSPQDGPSIEPVRGGSWSVSTSTGLPLPRTPKGGSESEAGSAVGTPRAASALTPSSDVLSARKTPPWSPEGFSLSGEGGSRSSFEQQRTVGGLLSPVGKVDMRQQMNALKEEVFELKQKLSRAEGAALKAEAETEKMLRLVGHLKVCLQLTTGSIAKHEDEVSRANEMVQESDMRQRKSEKALFAILDDTEKLLKEHNVQPKQAAIYLRYKVGPAEVEAIREDMKQLLKNVQMKAILGEKARQKELREQKVAAANAAEQKEREALAKVERGMEAAKKLMEETKRRTEEAERMAAVLQSMKEKEKKMKEEVEKELRAAQARAAEAQMLKQQVDALKGTEVTLRRELEVDMKETKVKMLEAEELEGKISAMEGTENVIQSELSGKKLRIKFLETSFPEIREGSGAKRLGHKAAEASGEKRRLTEELGLFEEQLTWTHEALARSRKRLVEVQEEAKECRTKVEEKEKEAKRIHLWLMEHEPYVLRYNAEKENEAHRKTTWNWWKKKDDIEHMEPTAALQHASAMVKAAAADLLRNKQASTSNDIQ